MRSVNTRYPVDRYLVECSKKFEMVNIIDDDIWNTEPALKPEDEIILRRLHEMLQSTADDLKLLSGELSKFHEPGVQIKTTPTPLDDEFNEKVHIEEIVNAKFHGYKIIDKHMPDSLKSNKDIGDDVKSALTNPFKSKVTNANINVNTVSINKKPVTYRNLGISRTNHIQINSNETTTKTEKLNNGKVINAPAVAYNEYSYNYIETKHKAPKNVLEVQVMPSINIRSELKEQKVLNIDIIPENKIPEKINADNVAVVVVNHEIPKDPEPEAPHLQLATAKSSNTIRRVSKLSTCESSGSNNTSSDTQIKLKTQKSLLRTMRSSPKNSSRVKHNKVTSEKQSDKRSQLHLDNWRQKLNTVYGASKSNNHKFRAKNKAKASPKKSNIRRDSASKSKLNNIEYVPYSKLTIGGVRASDIEKEISGIPNKNDIPLSPIVDRILSSRENSFSSPRKHEENYPKILTTSDENLLQEVIDIEKTVSETLSQNLKDLRNKQKLQHTPSDTDETKGSESYADDFEDDKSDGSLKAQDNKSSSNSISKNKSPINANNNDNDVAGPSSSNTNNHNVTYTKTSNLSFKNQVDIFEYVHLVDTQDSATQSQTNKKITPRETQMSPTCNVNIQPIHNDLWPSLDPNGEVETMFKLEKDFIKKLIAEEYGDFLEKNITKPSTSIHMENTNNVVSTQKNTQTSPAHVKHVMTSPTRTKTRTTSPFASLTVDHNTSPMIFVTNENNANVDIEEEEGLGISINLSSPRFSLRLPRNSREVLSNLDDSASRKEHKSEVSDKNNTTSVRTVSTSSMEADSSDISSLGEVKFRRKFGKVKKHPSDSESISSSSSKYSSDFQSGILPLRSEGEIFSCKKKLNKNSKSEGETSFGQFCP